MLSRVSGGEGQAWLGGERADIWRDYPESVQGFHIIGERTWFIRPEWEWPREERHRGVIIGPVDSAGRRQSLESRYELTYQTYLSGRGQDDEQLIFVNSERQLAGPAYRWAAINSKFARALGWQPSEHAPFHWTDASGATMVKSVYWKDGWIGLEPPRFESLGEGWVVLAVPEAIDTMRRSAPKAEIHLWIERHSHGPKPYDGRWHLAKPL